MSRPRPSPRAPVIVLPCSGPSTTLQRRASAPSRRPLTPPVRSAGCVGSDLQGAIALEEGNRALAVVATLLFAADRGGHDPGALRLSPGAGTGPPRHPLLALLHRRDGGHGGIRRLQLRPAEPVVAGLRDSPDRRRRRARVDRLCPLHEHLGEPPNRAVTRATPGARDGRSRDRHRPRGRRHQRGAGPGGRRSISRCHRARPREPLPGPGSCARCSGRHRGRHAVADAPHGQHRRRQSGRGPDQCGSHEH